MPEQRKYLHVAYFSSGWTYMTELAYRKICEQVGETLPAIPADPVDAEIRYMDYDEFWGAHFMAGEG